MNKDDKAEFFDHTFILKICLLEYLYREAMHLQCFTPKRYVMGVATRTYQPLPDWLKTGA